MKRRGFFGALAGLVAAPIAAKAAADIAENIPNVPEPTKLEVRPPPQWIDDLDVTCCSGFSCGITSHQHEEVSFKKVEIG